MDNRSKIITLPKFPSKALQNDRTLYIYLPPSYASDPGRRYPVVYMHDGENLFHPAQLSGVAWDVHHCCDRLIRKGQLQEIIIVGIAGTENRICEYTHAAGVDEFAHVENRGELYEKFVVEEVKPYIDANFRTLSNRDHTAMIGSSLGALVSSYICFRHPEVFGKVGMMSSSFWWGNRSVLHELQNGEMGKKWDFKIWIDTGDQEVSDVPNYMVEDAAQVVSALEQRGYRLGEDLQFFVDTGGIHSETAWAKRIHLPLLFFYGCQGQ